MGLLARKQTLPTCVKMTVIQVYSPTNNTSGEDKDTFYELLQKEIDAESLHDLLIVLGDANAKVGSNSTGWEGTMVDEGLGTMNDNGLKLHLCALKTVLSLEALVSSIKTSTSTRGHHQMAGIR